MYQYTVELVLQPKLALYLARIGVKILFARNCDGRISALGRFTTSGYSANIRSVRTLHQVNNSY